MVMGASKTKRCPSSSHHHLPCPSLPEIPDERASSAPSLSDISRSPSEPMMLSSPGRAGNDGDAWGAPAPARSRAARQVPRSNDRSGKGGATRTTLRICADQSPDWDPQRHPPFPRGTSIKNDLYPARLSSETVTGGGVSSGSQKEVAQVSSVSHRKQPAFGGRSETSLRPHFGMSRVQFTRQSLWPFSGPLSHCSSGSSRTPSPHRGPYTQPGAHSPYPPRFSLSSHCSKGA